MTTATASASTGTLTRWTIDPAHTHVSFTVRHMMITNVRGEFQKVAGEVTFDPAHPEQITINATIDVNSINTRDEKRDGHLRSPDFLDVAKFPTLTFTSKSSRKPSSELLAVPATQKCVAGTARTKSLGVRRPFRGCGRRPPSRSRAHGPGPSARPRPAASPPRRGGGR